MKHLDFVYRWTEGLDKSQCWSGTPYGVLNALQRLYHVDEVDIIYTKSDLLKQKIINNIGYRLKIGYPFFEQILHQKKIEKIYNSRESLNPIIQFLDFHHSRVADSYVYQDVTFPYLYRLRVSKSDLQRYACVDSRVSDKHMQNRCLSALRYYNDCKGVFCMSEWIKKDMCQNKDISPDKTHVVGAGININSGEVNVNAKSGNKFLFVGIDFERKGGVDVVKAFQKLYLYDQSLELHIAGPKMWPLSIPVPKGVYFHGSIQSKSRLVQLYNACDVFVMPSYFEPYGLVFAEALVCGLPCIGRNSFAMPEIIRDDGVLVASESSDELAQAMNTVIHDEKMRKSAIKKHLEYVERFSWDAVARRIESVIQ